MSNGESEIVNVKCFNDNVCAGFLAAFIIVLLEDPVEECPWSGWGWFNYDHKSCPYLDKVDEGEAVDLAVVGDLHTEFIGVEHSHEACCGLNDNGFRAVIQSFHVCMNVGSVEVEIN